MLSIILLFLFFLQFLNIQTLIKLKKKDLLKKKERALFVLTDDFKEILIGLLLGDLNARKRSEKGNTKLRFAQGLAHEAYLLHLYNLFQDYCQSGPKFYTRKPDPRTNKIYSSISF
jgi:hypothetical protein